MPDIDPPGGMPAPVAPAVAAPSSLNLDDMRAARREGRGDAIEVTNKGQEFLLPIELPQDAIEPLAAMADIDQAAEDDPTQLQVIADSLRSGLAGLFCTGCQEDGKIPTDDATGYPAGAPARHGEQCQWPRFIATRPSLDDMLSLWEGLFTAYGVSLGEALASLEQSTADGAQSKPTLPATTKRTRAKSSPAPRARKGARSSRA